MGLVLLYRNITAKMKENENIEDLSGNNLDGQLESQYFDLVAGKGYTFTADIRVSYSSVMDVSAFSIGARITKTGLSESQAVYGIIHKPGCWDLRLEKSGGNLYPYFTVYIDGTPYTVSGSTAISLGSDHEYLIQGSYDGSKQKLFMNGEELASEDRTGSPDTNSDDLFIGIQGGSNSFFTGGGKIREVKITDTGLTLAQHKSDLLRLLPHEGKTAIDLVDFTLGTSTYAFCTYHEDCEITTPQGTYTYKAVGLKRGAIRQRKNLAEVDLSIQLPLTSELETALQSQDPRGAWLYCRRIWSDDDFTYPETLRTLFYGQIEAYSVEGGVLSISAKQISRRLENPWPRRRFSYFCPWVFKSSDCGYTGSSSSCDHTLPTCQSLGNESNYGGFPTIPRLQRYGSL